MQMTVNSIPIYIEIDTVSYCDSLCRPLKRAPIFLCCNRGVTHAPLKRGGSTPSLRLYRPSGSKFRRLCLLAKLEFNELNNWIPSNYTNAYNVFSLHLTCNQNHLRFSQVVFLFTRCRKAAR